MINKDEAIAFARQEFEFQKIYLETVFELPHLTHIPDNSEIMALLEKAAREPDFCDSWAFDTLKKMAGDILRRGGFFYDKTGEKVFMHDWLMSFAADVLEGERPRPTKRGPNKYESLFRDTCLARVVRQVAEKFDIPRYTNNELSQKITAAEIVADAAGVREDVVINAYKKSSRG